MVTIPVWLLCVLIYFALFGAGLQIYWAYVIGTLNGEFHENEKQVKIDKLLKENETLINRIDIQQSVIDQIKGK